jgi:Peptidase family M28
MKKILLVAIIVCAGLLGTAQNIDKIINATEVERIEKILSADDMNGRKPFTPGIQKAADFIAAEFKKSGLQYFEKGETYLQNFSMAKAKFIAATGNFDGAIIDGKNIIAFTTNALVQFNELSGYEKVSIGSGANFQNECFKYIDSKKNYLVLVDTSFAKNFVKLTRFKRESFKDNRNVVFVLTASNPTKYEFEIKHDISESNLFNVVGILPGKSKKDEYVIFSGHYDHLGIGKANDAKDSIFNGANDDAAGTTAVMMLANYFAKIKNNERTIIFVAFTAEESGGFGSSYFSKQVNPDKVVAMFNIEMIGTESKWGTNSAYITGYEKSDMGKLLQANLTGSKFKFEPDPYPDQNLFYRSDNATLAALGVPAHTISTSKMDSEKFYHTQDDEIETLDMKNMAEIIKAIALSATSIINGKDTPSRVEKMK